MLYTDPLLNTTRSQAALERRLVTGETTRLELKTLLRERDTTIERLEADRRCSLSANKKRERKRSVYLRSARKKR
jgi:hypothetical protein